MTKVAVSIVNLNCLEHTKNLISDLDRQTHPNFEVWFYDQNSTEDGTSEFLDQLRKRTNYTVVQNGFNKPLNHVWNDFANSVDPSVDLLCFLNNDIRISSNYLHDSVNVLSKDARVGIAIHATNNRDFSTATSPTRHIFMGEAVKQGWEFTLRRNEWKDIPQVLQFYCGDDFIFHNQFQAGKKVGVITSSPVIHKLSQTREAMGEEFTAQIKKQALLDIENYKKLGFPHVWNNIPKQSRINQELRQIVEVTTEINLCKFNEYKMRLLQHLDDVADVPGCIIDIGVNDILTFDAMLDAAMAQNKKLIGVDSVEKLSKDIVSNNAANRPAEKIRNNQVAQTKSEHFVIANTGFLNNVADLRHKASFIFVGIFNPVKLRGIIHHLWDLLEVGGTLFFPYYNYGSCPEVAKVVDDFFASKQDDILCSRMQTHKGVHDTYFVVKNFRTNREYASRTKPLVVASVLKTGGIYDEHYVNKLASAVKRHMPSDIDYKFVCLTDSADGLMDLNLVDTVIPLQYNLPGWWSKLELFRPELFGDSQVLYIDLDTLITDNISDFASYGGEFMALREFNCLVEMGSGVLGWQTEKAHHIFYKFMRELINGDISIRQFVGGDQQAIEHFLELKPQWVQDLFPKRMAAFKYECFNEELGEVNIPKNAAIVCFHSKPKMADLESDPAIKKHWR